MTKKYKEILNTIRVRTSTVANRTILTESESDRGRVLFCAAFRRLQQKAQVFSMEPNAAVRSRLTHSLEVSQIGRYIADQVSMKLISAELATEQECMALVTFVETACLMHDIGNPPFGHFGEAAISKWFKDEGREKMSTSFIATFKNEPKKTIGEPQWEMKSKKTLADFFEFDGNPQGLRVVTKLQWNTDPHGLNLTNTTIASYLKYIRMAGAEIDSNCNPKFTTKAGYFSTEKEQVDAIWNHYNYETAQRFPLAYIMEAADDIAYCISDLEDSIEKELVNQKETLQSIKDHWLENHTEIDSTHDSINEALTFAINGKNSKNAEYTYTDFRTSINRIIVEYAAKNYVENHEKILNGTLDSLIPTSSGPGSILKSLKVHCQKMVYCHESVQITELAGYTAIIGLLNKFSLLLECSAERFKCSLDYSKKEDAEKISIIIENKYLKLFPEKYIKAYLHRLDEIIGRDDYFYLEWNARAHLIVDFISGMTDDFSVKTYRNLSGMLI